MLEYQKQIIYFIDMVLKYLPLANAYMLLVLVRNSNHARNKTNNK